MKILYLEDHTLFAEGFSVLLSNHRQDTMIKCVTTTEQALAVIAEEHDLDLILVDLNMPGLDGLAFIDGLNQRDLFIPFIILSASEDMHEIQKAMDFGASGFIPKSYSSQQILIAIDQVMAGETVIPKEIAEQLAAMSDNRSHEKQQALAQEYKIAKRQLDVLRLMYKGYSNKDIASVLNISINTVKVHVRTLCDAFQVDNRTDCVFYAEKIGMFN